MAGDGWLCLVTDRRRLAEAAGAPLDVGPLLLARQVEGAVAARVNIVQVRERDLNGREMVALVTTLARITHGSRTRLLVNDRIDVALAAGADGVQLREDSPSPAIVRCTVPAGWLLGRSVHGPAGVKQARGADFLLAGTVFSTPSKSGSGTLLGLSGLAAVVDVATPLPVLAIGGVAEAEAGTVAAAGARGLASIGAFLPRQPGDDPARTVQERAMLLRLAFDRLGRVP